MAENRPRIFQGGRDIFLTLFVTFIVMIGAVGLTGMCTFNPGAPEQGPAREVDAEAFINLEARAMGFPVVLPESPEGWVTNSARRTGIAQESAPVIGWVTADGGYIQMTQTDVPLIDAVEGYDGEYREEESVAQVAGEDVHLFTSEFSDVRAVRAVDLGDVRLLFSGAATDEEFTELITNAIDAEPVSTE